MKSDRELAFGAQFVIEKKMRQLFASGEFEKKITKKNIHANVCVYIFIGIR